MSNPTASDLHATAREYARMFTDWLRRALGDAQHACTPWVGIPCKYEYCSDSDTIKADIPTDIIGELQVRTSGASVREYMRWCHIKLYGNDKGFDQTDSREAFNYGVELARSRELDPSQISVMIEAWMLDHKHIPAAIENKIAQFICGDATNHQPPTTNHQQTPDTMKSTQQIPDVYARDIPIEAVRQLQFQCKNPRDSKNVAYITDDGLSLPAEFTKSGKPFSVKIDTFKPTGNPPIPILTDTLAEIVGKACRWSGISIRMSYQYTQPGRFASIAFTVPTAIYTACRIVDVKKPGIYL